MKSTEQKSQRISFPGLTVMSDNLVLLSPEIKKSFWGKNGSEYSIELLNADLPSEVLINKDKSEVYYALTPTVLLYGYRKVYSKDPDTMELVENLKEIVPQSSVVNAPCRMNIVELEEGEAIGIKEGNPFAFLFGSGIKISLNLNNQVPETKKPLEPNVLGSLEDDFGEHFFSPDTGFVVTAMKDGYFRNDSVGERVLVCTAGSAIINEEYNLKEEQICLVHNSVPLDIEIDGTVVLVES